MNHKLNTNTVLIIMASLLSGLSSISGASAADPFTDGGSHSEIIYKGRLPYSFSGAYFGYNQDTGNAWVVVQTGENQSVDGGSIWVGTPVEFPVSGLSLDLGTREIKYKGVVCAKAKPNAVFNAADYPQKMYSTCKIQNSVEMSEPDFKGVSHEVSAIRLVVGS